MRKTLTMLFVLGLFFSAWAQEVQITDVRKKEFKGVKAILNKTTKKPEGYYTFYVSEKVGGGMVNFTLELYDTDLNLIKKTPITISKHSQISSSAFNGEGFMFAFADIQRRKLTFATIDNEGNIIKQQEIKAEKTYTTDADVFPAQNAGFYVVRPIKEKKIGYKIEKVDHNLNVLWEQRMVPDKGYIGVEAIESANDRLIVTQMKGAALLSKKMIGQIVCFDDKSGDKLFTHDLYDGAVTGVPSAFLIDKDKNVIAGGMYFDGEKWDHTNSDGIFFLKLSPSGKKLAFETAAWKDGIQKFLKASTTGFAISSKPKVFFEDIIETPEGYKVISETFRKNMAVAGSSVALLKRISGSGHVLGWDDDNGSSTFEIMDLMLFNFSKEGKLSGMTHIPKTHTKITLLSPFANMGGITLSRVVREYGYFDYSFSISHPVTGHPVIVSRNLDKRPVISMHMIGENNSLATKSIALDRMPGTVTDARVGALPGTNGRMCVYFYDKKEQTITLYLQDMDLTKTFSKN